MRILVLLCLLLMPSICYGLPDMVDNSTWEDIMAFPQAEYKVLLKDNNGITVDHIENKITKLSWGWDRIGGCGSAKFNVKDEYDAALAGSFAEDYGIEIYLPTVGGTAALWYSGYVDKVTPTVQAGNESIGVSCLGYVNQLKRVIVRKQSYAGQELSVVARLVAEVYATSITDVTSTAADYENTGFTADSLYFDETAHSAIKKLAEIAGRREWGVRADKSLFFLARNDATTRYFNLTEDFTDYKPSRDYGPMITEIYLEGAEGYAQIFKVTNRLATRVQIVSNSSIKTQSVGQQYARMYLKEHGAVKRSYTATQVNQTERIESILPIGKAAINIKVGIKDLYDVATNIYDSGLKYDGGTEALQIEKIDYTLGDEGVDITYTFGPVLADIVDDVKRLEYEINTERALT